MSDRPLRVVFGVTSSEWGGNEKWAVTAAAGLAERGHDVTALFSSRILLEELERRGIRGRRALFVADWSVAGLISLTRHFLATRPDVVVLTRRREYMTGSLAAHFAARLARRRWGDAGRPLVALRLGLRRRLKDDFPSRSAFGRLADLIIVNSPSIREGLGRSEWLDKGKVRVLLNGVETTDASPDEGRSALQSFGIPPEARIIVAAGRLNRQKGFDVLIDAMAGVVSEMPAARLVILGDGKRLRSLQDRSSGLGLDDCVIFAGRRGDVREIMAAADVYVLSSRNEGMANTLLEAMSVGTAIVATDVSGTREAVRDGIDGLIVRPDDPEAIARSVIGLLCDPALAGRLGASARIRVEELFSVERMISELESMLVDALHVSGRA
ncbi:MAG: glycosyltransferase [Candidatus Eisenbacteria bacterium]|nr:glycosyltransferase [Candidatus Eisenbacteria bacterium]